MLKTTASNSPSTPPASRKRGRPPINGNAMTPNTLKKRKCNLMKESRKPLQITKLRVKAIAKRWKTASKNRNIQSISKSNDSSEESDSLNQSIDQHSFSERTIFRAQSEIIKCLPDNIYDCTHIFILCYRQFGLDKQLKNQLKTIVLPTGNMVTRQIRYQAKKVNSIIMKYKTVQDKIIHNWLNRILQHSVIEAAFDHAGVILPPELVPKSLQLARISRDECQNILSLSSRTKENQRNVSIQYVINVAKAGNLTSYTYGDCELLSNTVSCTRQYAKLVLVSIENGKEIELFKQNKRCQSILVSDWPKEITKFVLLPENSRPIRENEQVSIR